MITEGSEFFGEKAAARILDVHPRTLRRMRSRGLVAHYRTPTGRVRYKLEDLIEASRVERVPASGRECPHLSPNAQATSRGDAGTVRA